MAYTLGLWCAKGRIDEKGNFEITLRFKDKFVIKRVAEALGASPVFCKQIAMISFNCDVIRDDLVALIGENKQRWPQTPRQFLPDVVRGFFDGNGSIKRIKRNRLNSTIQCNDGPFLCGLMRTLREEAKIESGSYNSKEQCLRLGTRDTIKLGNYMYDTNPKLFLLRKKKKFDIIVS